MTIAINTSARGVEVTVSGLLSVEQARNLASELNDAAAEVIELRGCTSQIVRARADTPWSEISRLRKMGSSAMPYNLWRALTSEACEAVATGDVYEWLAEHPGHPFELYEPEAEEEVL